MTYKIKSKKSMSSPFWQKRKKDEEKELKRKESLIRFGYMELDDEAELQYGSKFSELSDKEQKEISKKVAKSI